jgi:hypothetical protein
LHIEHFPIKKGPIGSCYLILKLHHPSGDISYSEVRPLEDPPRLELRPEEAEEPFAEEREEEPSPAALRFRSW